MNIKYHIHLRKVKMAFPKLFNVETPKLIKKKYFMILRLSRKYVFP